jgi:hypothetical protein
VLLHHLHIRQHLVGRHFRLCWSRMWDGGIRFLDFKNG